MDTSLFYNMDALGIGGNSQVGEEWEAEAWKSLRNAILTLKTRVNIISEAYMQAVSVRESIVANKQARQVGYLTSLATLFIPLSFVAAVFSMGGDFAAGQERFYVFWAISLPITLVALCVYLFGGWVLSSLRKCSGTLEGEKHLV
jgi:Mg2+ and Co2+ transporter CorA